MAEYVCNEDVIGADRHTRFLCSFNDQRVFDHRKLFCRLVSHALISSLERNREEAELLGVKLRISVFNRALNRNAAIGMATHGSCGAVLHVFGIV